MKRFIIAATASMMVLTLTACYAETDNKDMGESSAGVFESAPVSIPSDDDSQTVDLGMADDVGEPSAGVFESAPVSIPANDDSLTVDVESADDALYGNTSGNISNDAFVAQDSESVYYVLPTDTEYMMSQGELMKKNTDGSVMAVLLSGGRPHCLNVVDGWIYYINSESGGGLIYKVREDGSENTLITSGYYAHDFMQGYTTQDMGSILKMVVVDNWIYCRVYEGNDDGNYNAIYRIDADSGEVVRLQQVGRYMAGLVIFDGWIYYSKGEGDNGAYTYRMRTDGTENTMIAEAWIPSPSIADGKIFYLGGDDASGSQIFSMDLDGTNIGRIADGIVAVSINAVGEWIYYATGSAVFKVKTDGTENTKLCDYSSTSDIEINVLNDWVYLRDRATGMHMMRTDGSDFQEVA